MLKQIFETVRELLFLLRDVRQNSESIAKLRRELEDVRHELWQLSAAVERLAQENLRTAQNERHEREKIVLQLENTLLRFELRLPPKQVFAVTVRYRLLE